ncbi:hypothetical protein K439DRAFT_1623700 [Ramaria rubella]|nr:hypothetical protein K439DRAFT_1623700 [Ramaria rubella]
MSSAVSGAFPAIDIITYSSTGDIRDLTHLTDERIHTLKFYDLPLCDFYGMLKIVPLVEPEYKLLSKQCLWLCWVVKRTSMDLWEHEMDSKNVMFTGLVAEATRSIALDVGMDIIQVIKRLYGELPPLPHVLIDRAQEDAQRWQHQAERLRRQAERFKNQAEAAEAGRREMEARYN